MKARSLVVLGLLVCGCARPLVELEQPYAVSSRAESRVVAPQCAEFPLPPYPDVPPRDRPDQVTVKVGFTIGATGRIRDVEAEVLRGAEGVEAAPFVTASLAAAALIHCRPAVRLPAAGAEDLTPQPIDYRSSVLYHFLRDEELARTGA